MRFEIEVDDCRCQRGDEKTRRVEILWLASLISHLPVTYCLQYLSIIMVFQAFENPGERMRLKNCVELCRIAKIIIGARWWKYVDATEFVKGLT
jgi:hypothetical protein